MYVLIPVKSLDHAKTRLRGVLDRDQRREIARCLLVDVLDTLGGVSWVDRVVVVTSNPEVAQRARERGAVTVEEPTMSPTPDDRHAPLNAALEAGRVWAINDGASTLATLPVDLPLLPGLDTQRLGRDLGVERARDDGNAGSLPDVWIHTDEQRDGTNLLVQRPVDTIPFRYGTGSFRRHSQESDLIGATVTELQDPTLVWDLDHPDDPAHWASRLRTDPERRALYDRARARGTALRFLEETDWGTPLRDLRSTPRG